MRRKKATFKFTKATFTALEAIEEVKKGNKVVVAAVEIGGVVEVINFEGTITKKKAMQEYMKKSDDYVPVNVALDPKEETYIMSAEDFMKHGTLVETPKTEEVEAEA